MNLKMNKARLDWFSLPALACVVTLALPPEFVSPAVRVTTSAQSTTAAGRAPAAQPAPAMPEHDRGSPRTYPVAGRGSPTLYQLQIESWDNQKHMVAWSAVSYQRPERQRLSPLGRRLLAALEQRLVERGTAHRSSMLRQLDRDRAVRVQGAQRTRDRGPFQRSP